MNCPYCHKVVDDYFATFWKNKRWHRACAVRYCGNLIDTLHKKTSSLSTTAGNYMQLKKELEESVNDLDALKKIYYQEKTDIEVAGLLLSGRVSFGVRSDTNALLHSGHIKPAIMDGRQVMALMDGKADVVGAVMNQKALYHPGTNNNQKLLSASTKKSNSELSVEEWSAKWKPVFQQQMKENGTLHELEYAGAMKKLGLETKEDVEMWLIQKE